jgi:hypothetical protein
MGHAGWLDDLRPPRFEPTTARRSGGGCQHLGDAVSEERITRNPTGDCRPGDLDWRSSCPMPNYAGLSRIDGLDSNSTIVAGSAMGWANCC